jgi:uncharacterized protein (TIGR02594 family)
MTPLIEMILKLIKAFAPKPDLKLVPTPDFGDLPTPEPIPEPLWLIVARKELGVKEYFYKQNKRILEYHLATTLSAKSQTTPWCASFVCWCLATAGFRSPNSARARDFLHWGMAINLPRIGCIVVLTRGDNDDSGHVGFWLGETANEYILLSGNTSNSVCFANFDKRRLLGFRWPR